MPDSSYEVHGIGVFECASEGPALKTDRDAADVLSAAWNAGAKLTAIPAERLDEEFFRLRTGLAGEFVQKFVTYGMHLAVVGDIARYLSGSSALADFVRECNRGRAVWFVEDRDQLAGRLCSLRGETN